jgi:hypothetical protein
MSSVKQLPYCSVLVIPAIASAQTSQINGVTRDSAGLAIPGAVVKVTQTATGIVRTTASGPEGEYVLPKVPIGPYLLEVSKEGFAKYAQKGIALQVDPTRTLTSCCKWAW